MGSNEFIPRRAVLWQRFVAWTLRLLAMPIQRMPRAFSLRIGDAIGIMGFHSARRARRIARRNLRIAGLPSLDATTLERDALIRRVFVSFAKSLIDFLRGPALTLEEMNRIVRIEGYEHVAAALEQNKGVVFATAHIGNWEFMGRWLAGHGVPMTVVAREPDDPVFGAFIRSLRENAGFRVANKGGSVRELLGVLKRCEALALLPDQNSGDLFCPFFGVPAGTVAGPAALALHSGAPLVPAYCLRLPDDTYLFRVLPPISTVSSGDRDADIARIMADVNTSIEAVVRHHPDQWLWLHDRWKSAFEEKNRERAWGTGRDAEAARAAVIRRRDGKT